MKTTQYFPIPLAKSLVDSVLPVPAGPAGAAPNFIWSAPVIVSQHLSVKGVITNRVVEPKYSYPYSKKALTYFIVTSSTSLSQ